MVAPRVRTVSGEETSGRPRPELAVERSGVRLIRYTLPSSGKENRIHSTQEVEVTGWYGLSIAALKMLGVFAAVATAARGFVAFGAWRTSWRNRLIGIEPHRHWTI
jgi:hypothetical protein